MRTGGFILNYIEYASTPLQNVLLINLEKSLEVAKEALANLKNLDYVNPSCLIDLKEKVSPVCTTVESIYLAQSKEKVPHFIDVLQLYFSLQQLLCIEIKNEGTENIFDHKDIDTIGKIESICHFFKNFHTCLNLKVYKIYDLKTQNQKINEINELVNNLRKFINANVN